MSRLGRLVRIHAFGFVTILAGTAVILACGSLMETGIRTDVPLAQYSEAPIVVTGGQSFELPGSTPEIERPAILPERARLSEEIVRVVSTTPGVDRIETESTDGIPLGGSVDSIVVFPAAGESVDVLADSVRRSLSGTASSAGPPIVVLTGDDRGRAAVPGLEVSGGNLITVAGVFGAFALLAVMFGMASTVTVSVQQRAREFALLRAVGASVGRVRRTLLIESVVIAAFASVCAVVPGALLGMWLFGILQSGGVADPAIEFRSGLLPVVFAASAALIASVGGSLIAARRAARIRPLQALVEAEVSDTWLTRWRVVWVVVFLGCGLALAAVTAAAEPGSTTTIASAGPACICLAVGLSLLSPAFTGVLAAGARRPVEALFGPVGSVAIGGLTARRSEVAAVVAPIVLLTAVGAGMLTMQQSENEANAASFAENLTADLVVDMPDGADAATVASMSSVPGVDAVSPVVPSVVFIEGLYDSPQSEDGLAVAGVDGPTADRTMSVTTEAGDLADLRGNTIALSPEHAATLGVSPGDSIPLWLGDGTLAEVTVAAVVRGSFGGEGVSILAPSSLVAPHTTAGLPTTLAVAVAADTDLDEVAAALGGPDRAVYDRASYSAEYAGDLKMLATVNYALVGLVAFYAAITMVCTLFAATLRRRRELALLRLAGATRRQVHAVVLAEALLMALIGTVIGTVAAAATVVPHSVARLSTIAPTDLWWIYPVVVVFTVGLAATTMTTPVLAWTRSRLNAGAVAA